MAEVEILTNYNDFEKLFRYIDVVGMYEERLNEKIVVRKQSAVNDNSFSWKSYDKTMKLNGHNLTEIDFDLSDVVLMGTENSL